jgi:DNA mismatch repair protein MutS
VNAALAQQRLDAVAALQGPNGVGTWKALRDAFKGVTDVGRVGARIALRQVRPRELVALGYSLQQAQQWPSLLPATDMLQRIGADLQMDPAYRAALPWSRPACCRTPAALVRDGGVIAHGHDAELDELRAIQTNCDGFLLDLETRERARSGIANLRVQFNKVHGFFIEVTQGQLDKVPSDYRRRQTLKNAERFITPELKAFEDKALSAQERALAREKWLYEQLLDDLAALCAGLSQVRLGKPATAGRAVLV